jgi:hypothetical protein
LQLDLVYNALALNLATYLATPPPNGLGFALSVDNAPAATIGCTGTPHIANGVQVFPGSVPIYRGNTLVGGLGASGDGVDQDDMVTFLGLHDAGVALNGSIGNAPKAMRADQLTAQGVHLRYVQCPQAPFIDSKADNVCEGK